MLAPMQGLTNRALRAVYGELATPDVLFTEFVRVRPNAKKVIADSDFVEATTSVPGIPLVVQVIGCADDGVVDAVSDLVARGVQHINVNMGCPFGRMTSVLAGGGMFKYPETVYPMLAAMRQIVPGSLSVKTRLGIDDQREVFSVLDAFEKASVDFLVVHSRTVKQKYKGEADHDLSREIVLAAAMPVIANGDIRSVEDAQRVMKQTGAAGLMLGRGAIADHKIFDRIRSREPGNPSAEARQQEVTERLRRLLDGYEDIFHGDAQVMVKFKEVLAHIEAPELDRLKKRLKKASSCMTLRQQLQAI
ncbi:tRNA-dihydrouridine synthase C [Rubripirellula reticaptiva]|uniref:tRNA-dihydrouridine synthase n=2 Tax=Rubripirellula reticaptiva TaxID=2528013 RepID=A0A5C6EDD5_9BACT|nr:tRNA-dihydrouridine synthase C [Rubripirellula reticaptiva]